MNESAPKRMYQFPYMEYPDPTPPEIMWLQIISNKLDRIIELLEEKQNPTSDS